MLPRLLCSVDLVYHGIVERAYIDELYELAVAEAKGATLRGGTSTSLEEEGTSISYGLLDGEDILRLVPSLYQLYETTLVDIASRLSGVALRPSPDARNGINLNILPPSGGRYEWHYDSNPVTGLLVLSPCNRSEGGRLLFERDVEIQTAFCMQPGHFLVFDATRTPHAVEPVLGAKARVTAPMNFFVVGEDVVRPSDLDDTLYHGR